MAETIIIDKTVFNKGQFTLAVDTKFSELFAQSTPLTVDQFFISYNDLFFEIADNGINSHQELIQRSTDYLGEDLFAEERNVFLDQINALEFRVAELEEVDPEHPVFTNGSFLAVVEDTSIYVMDKGLARHIVSLDVWHVLLRASDPSQRALPNDELNGTSKILRLPPDAFNQIPKGQPYTLNDLSGKNSNESQSKTSSMLNKAISEASSILKGDNNKFTSPLKKASPKTTKKFITQDFSKLRNK